MLNGNHLQPIEDGCARHKKLAPRDFCSIWLEACPASAIIGHPSPDLASHPAPGPRLSSSASTAWPIRTLCFPNSAGIGGCRHPPYHNSRALPCATTIMPLSVHLPGILLERSLIKHKNDNPARTAWRSDNLTNATMTYEHRRRRTKMRDLDLPEAISS